MNHVKSLMSAPTFGLLLLLVLGGCVPASDSVTFNARQDTDNGAEDMAGGDTNLPDDMQMPDDMETPDDMQPPEDMGQDMQPPEDMGQDMPADMGADMLDMVDMGPDADVCVRETNAEFCMRLNAECGQLNGDDNCGISRIVTSCGTCGMNETCENNTCMACTPESDTEFCNRLGAECGMLAGTDNCGTMRSVNNCGNCTGAGESCQNNVCTCNAETDTEFCMRMNAECGSVSGTDNCGDARMVNSCGTCGMNELCNNNSCEMCTPETDTQFCTRLGAECGSLTGTDNCGNTRTVNNCGGCMGIDGMCVNNQCSCTAETDTEFCTRLNAECGSLTEIDNCGDSRTVTSCGTCGADTTCDMNTCVEDTCGDTVDNDGDMLVDCEDPDCLGKICHVSGKTCQNNNKCQ